MRATTQAPIFMASVFLLISLKVRAQKVDTIHLQVNTVLLNKENVNEVSNFGQPEHISNQDYTINAALGDIIIWKGTSTTSNYDKVQIKTIA